MWTTLRGRYWKRTAWRKGYDSVAQAIRTRCNSKTESKVQKGIKKLCKRERQREQRERERESQWPFCVGGRRVKERKGGSQNENKSGRLKQLAHLSWQSRARVFGSDKVVNVQHRRKAKQLHLLIPLLIPLTHHPAPVSNIISEKVRTHRPEAHLPVLMVCVIQTKLN